MGDTVFSIGVLALGWFVLGLVTGWLYRKPRSGGPSNSLRTSRLQELEPASMVN